MNFLTLADMLPVMKTIGSEIGRNRWRINVTRIAVIGYVIYNEAGKKKLTLKVDSLQDQVGVRK